MDAVVLALLSAFGFGLMTVLLRPALATGAEPLLGAFATVVVATLGGTRAASPW